MQALQDELEPLWVADGEDKQFVSERPVVGQQSRRYPAERLVRAIVAAAWAFSVEGV